MKKLHLKQRIHYLLTGLTGEDPEGTIEIYYHNPITHEVTLMEVHKGPADMKIEVDSPETAKTFLKCINHDQPSTDKNLKG